VIARLLLICSVCLLSGCSEPDKTGPAPVYPITGKVTVDGESPGEALQISVHNLDGYDPSVESKPGGLMQPDGSFALHTYNAGDGLPVGKYALTFEWKTLNMVSMSHSGEDRLKQRYANVEDSPKEFEVDGSGPVDLGTIPLTTK